MYRGQLLPGVHVDWVIQHREELFLKYADIIQVLVKMCERMREYKQAIDYAYKILSYDPLDEKIHQLLIRLHLLNGNHSGMSTLNCTVFLRT
ncbi:MAG: hypothetical protein GX963_02870 [Bacteroidales bacterium]|nr:hypothetical protein [Bacteroidales bacterium]